LELYARCKGNLVRVHEELAASGAPFSYQALTAFCRRQGIGHEPKRTRRRISLPARPGDAARHLSAPRRDRRPVAVCSDRLADLLLFAHALLSALSHLPPFRVQGLSH